MSGNKITRVISNLTDLTNERINSNYNSLRTSTTSVFSKYSYSDLSDDDFDDESIHRVDISRPSLNSMLVNNLSQSESTSRANLRQSMENHYETFDGLSKVKSGSNFSRISSFSNTSSSFDTYTPGLNDLLVEIAHQKHSNLSKTPLTLLNENLIDHESFTYNDLNENPNSYRLIGQDSAFFPTESNDTALEEVQYFNEKQLEFFDITYSTIISNQEYIIDCEDFYDDLIRNSFIILDEAFYENSSQLNLLVEKIPSSPPSCMNTHVRVYIQ